MAETKLIALTKGGMKAYWAALKEERRVAAAYYQSHPGVTVGEVAAKFRMSRGWVKRGLVENGVKLVRAERRAWVSRCPHCGEEVRHYCERVGADELPALSEAEVERLEAEARREEQEEIRALVHEFGSFHGEKNR